MGSREHDLMKGTLDLLILQVLHHGPRHGWSISRRIRDISEEVFDIGQGSLYPALHRLETSGWISAAWGVSELGRRAKFYRLTRSGRRRLRAASSQWQHFAATINDFMELPDPEPPHEPAREAGRSPSPVVES